MAKVPEVLAPGYPFPQQDLGLDLQGLSTIAGSQVSLRSQRRHGIPFLKWLSVWEAQTPQTHPSSYGSCYK